MIRIKLTEKYIRSAKVEPGEHHFILADTCVPALQVHVFIESKTYRFIKQINKKRYNKKIGSTNEISLADARRYAAELETKICNIVYRQNSNMLIKDACNDFLVPYYTHFVRGSSNPIGIISNYLVATFGDIQINALSVMQTQNSIHALMAEGYAPETIRKRILVGKTLYRQLIKHKLADFNPFSDLDLPTVSNIRTLVLTKEQRLPFIQCCRDEDSVYADCLLIQLATGLRVSEAIGIQSADISNDYTSLTLPRTKVGSAQHIALNSLAEEILRRRAALTWNTYLFPSPLHTATHISSPKGCFQRIKARMKILGHDIENLHQHDLRRTFASTCAEVTGGDMHMVASQLRHSSTHILRRYVHYQSDHIARASEETGKALLAPANQQGAQS